jgi:TRAP-type uncharacterized transport system substrate-binding protein
MAASPFVALCLAIAGCTEAPVTLRIVSGPPEANEQVAELLVSASAEVESRIHLAVGAAVATSEEALAALDEGRAELAIVENSASFRHQNVRTIAPLYPSVLHIGTRPGRVGQTLREVLAGATVFAGGEDVPSRRLLDRMVSMYAWSGVEFSYVDSLESRPDVVFVFAPISPRAAPVLDGYELLSLGRVAEVGNGSAADGLSLVAPFLRTFVIPEGTYGPLTPTPIVTVAIDTLLVSRADIPRIDIYDLAQELQMVGPLLVAQRPDLALDELETFEPSHVTFPVHPGSQRFRARNEPGFVERASGIMEVLIALIAAVGTGLLAAVRYWQNRKKTRIDKLYAEALAIRANFPPQPTAQQRAECLAQLRDMRERAFKLLIDEKLSADESFRILQALLRGLVGELERKSDRPVP